MDVIELVERLGEEFPDEVVSITIRMGGLVSLGVGDVYCVNIRAGHRDCSFMVDKGLADIAVHDAVLAEFNYWIKVMKEHEL